MLSQQTNVKLQQKMVKKAILRHLKLKNFKQISHKVQLKFRRTKKSAY